MMERCLLRRIVLFLVLFVAIGLNAKSGWEHSLDQIGAMGFSRRDAKVQRIVSITNELIDTVPGARDMKSFSLAAYFKQEAVKPPQTVHFKKLAARLGNGSHRASTHPFIRLKNGTFELAVDSPFVLAARIANPELSAEICFTRLNNAIQKAHQGLSHMYEAAFRLPSEYAQRVALGDVLIHYVGDYTTSNTMGLGNLDEIVDHLLELRQEIYPKEVVKEFRNKFNLAFRQGKYYEAATSFLSFLTDNGDYMNKYIMAHNGGKPVRYVTDSCLQQIYYKVRYDHENKFRMLALKKFFPKWAQRRYRHSIKVIGHRLYKGQTFFALLDETNLLDQYMQKGLTAKDIEVLDKYMESKGLSAGQRQRIKTHPDVKRGISGKQAVERRFWRDVEKRVRVDGGKATAMRGGVVNKSSYFVKRGATYGRFSFPKWGMAMAGDALFECTSLIFSGERRPEEYYKQGLSIAVAGVAAWGTETVLLAAGMSASMSSSSIMAALAVVSPVPVCGTATLIAGTVYLGVRWAVCAGWDAYAKKQRLRIEAECREIEWKYIARLRTKMIEQNTLKLKQLIEPSK